MLLYLLGSLIATYCMTKVNYVVIRDKSYSTTSSVLPPVEQNSWSIKVHMFLCEVSLCQHPEQSLNLPMPNQDAEEGAAAATRIDCQLYSSLQILCRGLCINTEVMCMTTSQRIYLHNYHTAVSYTHLTLPTIYSV